MIFFDNEIAIYYRMFMSWGGGGEGDRIYHWEE